MRAYAFSNGASPGSASSWQSHSRRLDNDTVRYWSVVSGINEDNANSSIISTQKITTKSL